MQRIAALTIYLYRNIFCIPPYTLVTLYYHHSVLIRYVLHPKTSVWTFPLFDIGVRALFFIMHSHPPNEITFLGLFEKSTD